MATNMTKPRAQTNKPVKGKAPAAKKAALSSASKSATVLALLKSGSGATIAEIAAVTGWQNHSVRGFMSGTVKKKLGHAVANEMVDGTRRYKITG